MNILAVNRHFENANSLGEPFLLALPAQRRRHQIDFELRYLRELLKQRAIDCSSAATQRRELVIEHQHPHQRCPPLRRRTTYSGRRLTSSKIRPTYSPITPIVISCMPARKKIATVIVAKPGGV